MRFLYSGATSYLAQQNIPSMSLGGYVSSSPIPNGRINSLFSDASYTSSKDGTVETYGIVLDNETNVDVTNLKLGYQYSSDPDFKIEIALVTVTNNQQFEKLGNPYDTPFYGTFSEANIDPDLSIDNSLNIGTLTANTRLGLWVRRTQIKQTTANCSDFSQTTPQKVNQVSFVLSWD